MVRHIKNYNLQTFLSFQQPPLLRHKLQFKYHHHQKKHHSAVKKKEKNKQNRKKRRKKKKIETEFQFSFFEAPLVILLRTTTKWLTIACETSVHSLLPTTIIIVKTLWEGHKMGDFFFKFLWLSQKSWSLSIIWWLYIPICIYFLLKKTTRQLQNLQNKNKHGLFILLSNQFFFCPTPSHIFSIKYDQKLPTLTKKRLQKLKQKRSDELIYLDE